MLNKFFKKKTKIQLPEQTFVQDDDEVVIHIGAPKTGSSALQKFFLDNRSGLKTLGYYYPHHGVDENGISGGHSVIGKMLGDGDIDGAKKKFNDYCENARRKNLKLLLSAESLFNKAELVKALVGDRKVKIVSFFRDPLESLYSNYNQGIKRHFSTIDLYSYCQNYLNKNAPFYSGKIFESWQEYFGKDAIIVIGYDPAVFADFPIQQVVTQVLGISKKDLDQHLEYSTQYINKSYPLSALELKRLLNLVLDRESHRFNNELDWFLQGVADNQNYDVFGLADRVEPVVYKQLLDKFTLSAKEVVGPLLVNINPDFMTAENAGERKALPDSLVLMNEIRAILTRIESEKSSLYKYLCGCVEQNLQELPFSLEASHLAILFNKEYRSTHTEAWFLRAQLRSMPDYETVDFLRDIANVCLMRGDLEDAKRLGDKALELRPKGRKIIELVERINEQLSSK